MTTKTATVRVQRFNPEVDKKPHLQSFQVEMTPETTLLDALEGIKATQDGTLTFRRSCRHAICGSCAMNVNGHNTLVCNQPLSRHLDRHDRVTIRPLPFLPIIKDLVVDRSNFWEQYRRVKPWLIRPTSCPRPSSASRRKRWRRSTMPSSASCAAPATPPVRSWR